MNGLSVCGSCDWPSFSAVLPLSCAAAGTAATITHANASATSALTLMVILSR